MTQLQAIIGSCLKWWRIRYKGERDRFSSNCPLCTMFFIDDKGCGKCPVKTVTLKDGCADSPWVKTPLQLYKFSTTEEKSTVLEELQFLFDLIKPRYYPNVKKELAKGDYPKKFITWMERAIKRAES